MDKVYVLFGKHSELEVEDGKYGGEILGYFSSYDKANRKANEVFDEWLELKILEAPVE